MQGTALIVEDDKQEADRIGQLISDAQWRVVICHDIPSACKLLKVEPFQMLLINLGLAHESALASLPMLRKLVSATPIAAFTNGGSAQDAAALPAALKAGADFTVADYLDDRQVRKLLGSLQTFKPALPHRTHVAIIEDCKVTRHLLFDAFCDKGYRASEAKTMEEAFKNLKMAEVDLVVTDIFMPGMGGIEGIRRIRASWPHIKIIAMSAGLDERMTADKALMASRMLGADAQLKKPFPSEHLLDVAAQLLTTAAA